jgi:hypothetical protein
VGQPLAKARRGSHSGAAKQEHGEARAEVMLRVGLPVVGLEAGELEHQSKGAFQKQVLAWWLCRHTTVRRRWVSEHLAMGDESRVTQAIRRIGSGAGPGVQRLKENLEKAYERGIPVEL